MQHWVNRWHKDANLLGSDPVIHFAHSVLWEIFAGKLLKYSLLSKNSRRHFFLQLQKVIFLFKLSCINNLEAYPKSLIFSPKMYFSPQYFILVSHYRLFVLNVLSINITYIYIILYIYAFYSISLYRIGYWQQPLDILLMVPLALSNFFFACKIMQNRNLSCCVLSSNNKKI